MTMDVINDLMLKLQDEVKKSTAAPKVAPPEYNKTLPAQMPKLRFLDRFMAGHKGYIAGGCFKQLLSGAKIKDVDLFFENAQDAKEAVDYFKANEEFTLAYENKRVLGYRCSKTNIVAEVIFSFLGTPDDIVSKFDFTVTKAWYGKELDGSYAAFFHQRFFEHLTTKKLVIDDEILFPLSTFNRSYRYRDYGFGLCGESRQKLVDALQGVEVNDIKDFYFGID